jgi:hypothetical protein
VFFVALEHPEEYPASRSGCLSTGAGNGATAVAGSFEARKVPPRLLSEGGVRWSGRGKTAGEERRGEERRGEERRGEERRGEERRGEERRGECPVRSRARSHGRVASPA